MAITSMKPPIFWKDKDIVKQQMQKLSINSTRSLIYKINDVDHDYLPRGMQCNFIALDILFICLPNEIIEFLNAQPELVTINSHIKRKDYSLE